MKKNYLISLLLLMLPMLANALTVGELAGTWSSTKPIELMKEGGNSLSVLPRYTFNTNGIVTDNTTMLFSEAQMGITMEYKIRTEILGGYDIDGDNVTFAYDNYHIILTCDKEDINVKGDIDAEQKSYIIDQLSEMINSMVIPQMMAQAAETNKDEQWTKVTVTSTTLSFDMDGQHYTLTKE